MTVLTTALERYGVGQVYRQALADRDAAKIKECEEALWPCTRPKTAAGSHKQ
jgi:hypothetical protein